MTEHIGVSLMSAEAVLRTLAEDSDAVEDALVSADAHREALVDRLLEALERGGNLEPITSLIVNREANEWARSAGVAALTLLAAWDAMPRAVVIDRLQWLVREGLERDSCVVWSHLAAYSAR